jgi:hypothetical protein
MVITFHQTRFAHANRYPVYVVGESIQAIEHERSGSLLLMVGGPEVIIEEEPAKVLEILAKALPNVWGGYKLERVEYNEID